MNTGAIMFKPSSNNSNQMLVAPVIPTPILKLTNKKVDLKLDVNIAELESVDLLDSSNVPGDSSNVIEKARSDMIHYLETLTKVDGNLGEILVTMPAALKRNIESDQFRVRANARFKELLFITSKSYLTSDEFAPQAMDLVSDKEWSHHLEPYEISKAILSVFGSPMPNQSLDDGMATVNTTNNSVCGELNTEVSAPKNIPTTSNGATDTTTTSNPTQSPPCPPPAPVELVLKKVAFQRLLASSTIVTFLETHSGGGATNNYSERKKLMASLSQYLKNMNNDNEGTRLKVGKMILYRSLLCLCTLHTHILKHHNTPVNIPTVEKKKKKG
jgi:hypothetical protein